MERGKGEEAVKGLVKSQKMMTTNLLELLTFFKEKKDKEMEELLFKLLKVRSTMGWFGVCVVVCGLCLDVVFFFLFF